MLIGAIIRIGMRFLRSDRNQEREPGQQRRGA